MENQEMATSVKTASEKNSFLTRLRTNKFIPLVFAGGLLFGGETSGATSKSELKKISQESALLKLMQDPTIKFQELQLAAETFLDLQGAQGEVSLFSVLKNPKLDNLVEWSIIDVLQSEIIKKVNKGEESEMAIKMYLDVLGDKSVDSKTFSRVLAVIGWRCVSEEMKVAGWGVDQDGKSFIIKGKEGPSVFTHIDLPAVLPLVTHLLGHADGTVRKSAQHELIGIILFSDKDGEALEEVRRLSKDSSNPFKQKEAQSIVDFIDQLNRQTPPSSVEEPVKEEPKKENVQFTSEYDKWINILKDKESKSRLEAFDELLKLGGDRAIFALAEFASQEAWVRDSLAQAIESKFLGEEYKKKAQVAKAALIDGVGALLKTNVNDAIDFLSRLPFDRQGGLSKYTDELMNAYFTAKSRLDKNRITIFFEKMPKEERKIAIKKAFGQLDTNDPVRQADALDLLLNITSEDKEDQKNFQARAEHIVLGVLSNINNRSTLDPVTKVKLLKYLPSNVPNSEAIANYLKNDTDPNVRHAAYEVLIKSGKDEMIGEMIKDQDREVKRAGYFHVITTALRLKNEHQYYENEANQLYDALRNESDEGVRADAVYYMTFLGLPADEALTDSSPKVRVNGVYNLQERVRNGDQTGLSRLKEIAANEQEDKYVRVKASEFVKDWEEGHRREQGADR